MRAAAVLHVARSRHSSVVIGYERTAETLRARGHSLELLTPEDLPTRGISPRLFPVVLPLLVRRWLRRRPDLDLVIFHSYTGWLAGRPRPGLRTVLAFHGFEPLFHRALEEETRRRGRRLSRRYALMYGALMPRMLRRACRNADLVLCLNTEERDALIAGGYAPAEKVALMWHDAPASYFMPHAYPPRATSLLCVMQWLPTKGTAYLVEAFTRLARRHHDLRLVIAGSLLPRETVSAEFPEDVRARVDVHPTFLDAEHRQLLSAADIFVHPSLYEAFGRAVVEAMAAGVPIVTTPTGIGVDRLTNGNDALIVPVADTGALVTAVESLLDDQPRRAAMGAAAQDHAARLLAADNTSVLAALLESLGSRA